ncbi:MAG TPA: NAD(P)H-dependent oxidoreductase [Gemmataceae bacterium]|nr:NAD(P)H-dependent oxidoreductase [Gemmataceae bacterium]
MPATPKVLAFAGSLRRDSYNKKLVRIAAEAARNAGAEVMLIDLADFPLPVFNEDDETASGMPENARRLKELFLSHHGLLISAPEYNSSVTAALKNAIDWVSRKGPGPLQAWPFGEKCAALLSASPGQLGGLRGLVHLRAILGNLDVLVLPDQLAVPRAHEAFQADGSLKDPRQQERVAAIAGKLVGLLRKLLA